MASDLTIGSMNPEGQRWNGSQWLSGADYVAWKNSQASQGVTSTSPGNLAVYNTGYSAPTAPARTPTAAPTRSSSQQQAVILYSPKGGTILAYPNTINTLLAQGWSTAPFTSPTKPYVMPTVPTGVVVNAPAALQAQTAPSAPAVVTGTPEQPTAALPVGTLVPSAEAPSVGLTQLGYVSPSTGQHEYVPVEQFQALTASQQRTLSRVGVEEFNRIEFGKMMTSAAARKAMTVDLLGKPDKDGNYSIDQILNAIRTKGVALGTLRALGFDTDSIAKGLQAVDKRDNAQQAMAEFAVKETFIGPLPKGEERPQVAVGYDVAGYLTSNINPKTGTVSSEAVQTVVDAGFDPMYVAGLAHTVAVNNVLQKLGEPQGTDAQYTTLQVASRLQDKSVTVSQLKMAGVPVPEGLTEKSTAGQIAEAQARATTQQYNAPPELLGALKRPEPPESGDDWEGMLANINYAAINTSRKAAWNLADEYSRQFNLNEDDKNKLQNWALFQGSASGSFGQSATIAARAATDEAAQMASGAMTALLAAPITIAQAAVRYPDKGVGRWVQEAAITIPITALELAIATPVFVAGLAGQAMREGPGSTAKGVASGVSKMAKSAVMPWTTSGAEWGQSVVFTGYMARGAGIGAMKTAKGGYTYAIGTPTRSLIVEGSQDVARIPWKEAGYVPSKQIVGASESVQLLNKIAPEVAGEVAKYSKKGGVVDVTIDVPGKGQIQLKTTLSPAQLRDPQILYSGVSDMTRMLNDLKRTGKIVVEGELYTSPQLAADFMRRSASGIPPKNPGVIAIRVSDLRGYHLPVKEYKGAIEAEVVAEHGVEVLPTTPNFWSSHFGKSDGLTGESFTQYQGPTQTFMVDAKGKITTDPALSVGRATIRHGQLAPVYWMRMRGAPSSAPTLAGFHAIGLAALKAALSDIPYLRPRSIRFTYGEDSGLGLLRSSRRAYSDIKVIEKQLEAKALEEARKAKTPEEAVKRYFDTLDKSYKEELGKVISNPEVARAIREDSAFRDAYTVNLQRMLTISALGDLGRLDEPPATLGLSYRDGKLEVVSPPRSPSATRARAEQPSAISEVRGEPSARAREVTGRAGEEPSTIRASESRGAPERVPSRETTERTPSREATSRGEELSGRTGEAPSRVEPSLRETTREPSREAPSREGREAPSYAGREGTSYTGREGAEYDSRSYRGYGESALPYPPTVPPIPPEAGESETRQQVPPGSVAWAMGKVRIGQGVDKHDVPIWWYVAPPYKDPPIPLKGPPIGARNTYSVRPKDTIQVIGGTENIPRSVVTDIGWAQVEVQDGQKIRFVSKKETASEKAKAAKTQDSGMGEQNPVANARQEFNQAEGEEGQLVEGGEPLLAPKRSVVGRTKLAKRRSYNNSSRSSVLKGVIA